MSGARIAILTASHFCHNPRVIKEATALARSGFEVEILGAVTEVDLKERDEALLKDLPITFTPVIDLVSSSLSSRAAGEAVRAKYKVARSIFQWTGLSSRTLLGIAAGALCRAVQRTAADLYIAHLEPSLAAAKELLSSGSRVAMDMEDWHSEDLLPEARRERPVGLLAELEREVLSKCLYSTCPSQAMSAAIAEAYSCPSPIVIYNAFPWSARSVTDRQWLDRKYRGVPSIHWYSQTIGPGRGLEDLFGALPALQYETEIHLRGRPVQGFDAWLSSRIPARLRDRVFVHGLVCNESLLSRIQEHDIGFAGEMQYCRSRDLTVTNKMLEYMQAGLAVVASDTAGQREVARQAGGAVLLYPSGDCASLAESLNALLGSPERLQVAKAAALRAAHETFCWERQEGVFLEAVMNALETPLRKGITR